MYEQKQFLEVIDRDEAHRRFRAAVRWQPLDEEEVPLDQAAGRVASRDVRAPVNVPSFDRSDFDGFAVRAADTYGADEETPRSLKLSPLLLTTGPLSPPPLEPGTALAIATGAMIPRGADAIVMVEHAHPGVGEVFIHKSVAPGFGVTFAGTDISIGETILRRGELLTSRETGVLAAVGVDRLTVWRKPRVSILSTGDEIIPPGEPMRPGCVYDSNARVVADAVRELGGEPLPMGIVPDRIDALRGKLAEALAVSDLVLLSGGTSKGVGDCSYRVVSELTDPGVVAHGVALKPGKPICLAATGGKAVAVLPGFPTSAIFTFHEFLAPLILALGGRPAPERCAVKARLATKLQSEVGRTEYLLVGLVESSEGLAAFPMGKGSGSVTAFARADGFIAIDRHREILEEGALCDVVLLGGGLRPADLIVMGSHCVGLDYLLGLLQGGGWQTKFMAIGSTAGLEAAKRGECDIAPAHLLDPDSGLYNFPFLTPSLRLLKGYRRLQGVVFRREDERFEGKEAVRAVRDVRGDPHCQMINRNRGSGTRILIDQLLEGARPPGYAVQARSHSAVAAAVVQGRADWGVAIATAAAAEGLGFLPLADEEFDFVIPQARWERPAVRAFRELLESGQVDEALARLGFRRERAEMEGAAVPRPLEDPGAPLTARPARGARGGRAPKRGSEQAPC